MADIFNAVLGGFDFLSSAAEGSDARKEKSAQYEAAQRQGLSDQETALQNAGILGTQKDAFNTQQDEIVTDIQEVGDQTLAERSALAAAEGFGGGGTARSVQAGISRKVTRDINRVRDSQAAQSSIFDQQIAQKETQATAFGVEATFAGEQAGIAVGEDLSWKEKIFRPSTWFL